MSENIPEYVSDLMEFLQCPCTYFAPTSQPDVLLEKYHQALEESKQSKDFVPVFLTASETLLETLLLNSDTESDGTMDTWNVSKVEDFRKGFLENDSANGAVALGDLVVSLAESFGEPHVFEEKINEVGGTALVQKEILSWVDLDAEEYMTLPLILAKIPVQHFYEIFAWIPFGGWNDCPSNTTLMSVSRLWQEKYGALPAIISENSIEYIVDNPIKDVSEARDLAIKHYAFCAEVFEGIDEDVSIAAYAKALLETTVWYFWWN